MSYGARQLSREIERRLDVRPETLLSELATALRVHRTSIERSIRIVRGISFRGLRQEAVLRKLMRLIEENPTMSNKQIGLELGYTSPEAFYRFVRITTGSTATSRMIIDHSGNVGIGTTTPLALLHVAGNVTVDGNIAAKYQDVAEWVPASSTLPRATVVVQDEQRTNHVLSSSSAYDTRVAGVITEAPGILLGEGGAGQVKVATTGRVKVKADATQGPIRIGDLLVTSDREGTAMRSEPVVVGGVPLHRPGTVIGKALEPLREGQKEILVLLSLQ